MGGSDGLLGNRVGCAACCIFSKPNPTSTFGSLEVVGTYVLGYREILIIIYSGSLKVFVGDFIKALRMEIIGCLELFF
jgi:hypothetical protein